MSLGPLGMKAALGAARDKYYSRKLSRKGVKTYESSKAFSCRRGRSRTRRIYPDRAFGRSSILGRSQEYEHWYCAYEFME